MAVVGQGIFGNVFGLQQLDAAVTGLKIKEQKIPQGWPFVTNSVFSFSQISMWLFGTDFTDLEKRCQKLLTKKTVGAAFGIDFTDLR